MNKYNYEILFPKKFSGSMLKTFAVASMLVDHIACYLLNDVATLNHVWFTVLGQPVTGIWLLRMVGRFAFPLFVFLLVQGYLHTRNRKKYGLYLLLFALVSEIPFDLVHYGYLEYSSQNIFFSLLFGYIGMYLWNYWQYDRFNRMVSILMLSGAVIISRCDYNLPGFIFIMVMYAWHTHPVIKTGATAWLLPGSFFVFLSSFLMASYDGTRGFIRTPAMKYAFYAIYPVHLLIIYLIKQLI